MRVGTANLQAWGGGSEWSIIFGVTAGMVFLAGIALALISGSWVGALAFLLLSMAVTACFIGADRGSVSRLARLYRPRYVLPSDLDNAAHVLFKRASDAISTISRSEVNRWGYLDSVANHVLLPQQLWEICRLLRDQSFLRAEQARATHGVIVTAELRAVLAPQQRAIQHSANMVTKRVVELEAYAHRVLEADAALRAQAQLRNNNQYHNLLAHTDDRLGMKRLLQEAASVEGTLARSVQDAVTAGQTLALPDLERWGQT
ncbi:hypothetical protein ACIHFD_48060 [Nonomuraea sp. NPDC051941]|uniref:hypothetical protein n=1 Tax=Nonomuraea sp. NPDC051941 TaxID=3364373 RepID=UPI0037C7C828